MSLASYILPPQFRKNPIYLVLAIFLFFYLAYELAQYVVAGDLTGLAYVGLGSIVAAGLTTILNRWRTGLYVFLGWLFFEDLARKYLGNNMVIYFGKDALVGMVYLSFLPGAKGKCNSSSCLSVFHSSFFCGLASPRFLIPPQPTLSMASWA